MPRTPGPRKIGIESRRSFLGKLGLTLAGLAGLSVLLSGLGRNDRRRPTNESHEFPGEDSIFHPARDPRLDPRRSKSP